MEISNYTNDALELLKEQIAIPSVSREEKKAGICPSGVKATISGWGVRIGTTTVPR